MSAYYSGLVLIILITVAQAALFLRDQKNEAIRGTDQNYGKYYVVPSELDKLKRSFGRNCMFTISGCFTTSQAERYRKYMENVRFIPK